MMNHRIDQDLMNRVLKEKQIKISEMPDELDLEDLPDDVEIVLDENFPELEDAFWDEL